MMDTSPIWTLNARDNVILDVLSSHLALSDSQTRSIITASRDELFQILAHKGIDYGTLRAALVPQRDREEYVFLFEVQELEKFSGPSYSAVAGGKILPLLHPQTTCSILHGDLIHPDVNLGIALLNRYMVKERSIRIISTHDIFGIYINNLTQGMFERIHTGLVGYSPYLGYAGVTQSSPMKDWMSATLGSCYLKARRRFICGHEDDVSNEQNANLPMWPLEDSGYEYSSLQLIYFDLFLSYKIERAIYPGFEDDIRYGLGAISGSPMPLAEFQVVIGDDKLLYLREGEHAGSLKIAGLTEHSANALGELIRSKLNENYIYNLRFRKDSNTSLFNMIIEVPVPGRSAKVRLMAALEYKPDERILRLVTLF